MDERRYPRIQLPFEVELAHPLLGTLQCIARDISESGMFVVMDSSGLRVGSTVKVTAVSNMLAEITATPTVTLEVARLAPDGAGLKFTNRTSRHLWESVVQQRVELAVGRDYFQVFQGAVVVDQQRRVLVVQQHGRWLFPGAYLLVGQPWRESLETFLATELGVAGVTFLETLHVDSGADVIAAERAMLSLFHRFATHTTRERRPQRGRYARIRWVSALGVEELTFSHDLLRDVARRALTRAALDAESTDSLRDG